MELCLAFQLSGHLTINTIDTTGRFLYTRPMKSEIRKTMSLPPSAWNAIADIRFSLRLRSEAQAVREIVAAGVKVLKKRTKARSP
jgi:hypothetical protein